MEFILLQAPGAGGGITQLLFMGALFAVAYFFLIRPQAKRNREQQNFVKEIEKGDNVVTTSGIHGKVMDIEGDIATLQIDSKKGINIRISKAAISKEMTDAVNKEEEK